MQQELVMIGLSVLGAIGTWTVTVALLVLWLANRFRSLEALIYAEMTKLRREVGKEVEAVERRMGLIERQVHRLQLKVFGFAPLAMDEMLDRLAEMPEEK